MAPVGVFFFSSFFSLCATFLLCRYPFEVAIVCSQFGRMALLFAVGDVACRGRAVCYLASSPLPPLPPPIPSLPYIPRPLSPPGPHAFRSAPLHYLSDLTVQPIIYMHGSSLARVAPCLAQGSPHIA